MNPHTNRFALFVLLSCFFLAMGCSYTVIPGKLPAPAVSPGADCSGASVLLVNAEKVGADTPITRLGNSRSDLRTNKKEWSNAIVEYLATELSRKGCRVQANATVVISVSIPDIILKEEVPAAQFTVRMQAASSTGWLKTYEATAKTDRVSAPNDADRLLTQAFGETATSMLNDAEFRMQLLKK